MCVCVHITDIVSNKSTHSFPLEWLLINLMHRGARRRAQRAESRCWWRKAPRTLHDMEICGMTGFRKSYMLYLLDFVSLPSRIFWIPTGFSGLLCHWHVMLVKKMHRGRQEKKTSKDKKSSKAKGSKADSKESGSLGSKDFGSSEAKPHDRHMLPAEGQAENKKQGHSFFTRYRCYRWYRCPTAN